MDLQGYQELARRPAAPEWQLYFERMFSKVPYRHDIHVNSLEPIVYDRMKQGNIIHIILSAESMWKPSENSGKCAPLPKEYIYPTCQTPVAQFVVVYRFHIALTASESTKPEWKHVTIYPEELPKKRNLMSELEWPFNYWLSSSFTSRWYCGWIPLHHWMWYWKKTCHKYLTLLCNSWLRHII